jgi:hypothetical protein
MYNLDLSLSKIQYAESEKNSLTNDFFMGHQRENYKLSYSLYISSFNGLVHMSYTRTIEQK